MTNPNPETGSTAPASVPAVPRSIAEHRTSEFHSASGRQLADEVASSFEACVHRLAPDIETSAVEHVAAVLRETLEERFDSLIDTYVSDAIVELVAVEDAADEAGEDAAA